MATPLCYMFVSVAVKYTKVSLALDRIEVNNEGVCILHRGPGALGFVHTGLVVFIS